MTIEIKNLNKKFNNILAVKNINFKINKGSIVGLLGPNGCGKTTTIGMMLGLIKPTAGTVFIKNGSATSGQNRLILDVDNGSTIDPYIADNGILCEDGAYFAYDGTAVVGLSIQFDG